jgi:hypothetical protein
MRQRGIQLIPVNFSSAVLFDSRLRVERSKNLRSD